MTVQAVETDEDAAKPQEFRVELFEGSQGIAEIGGAWQALSLSEAGPYNFFQSASWCTNWLKAHDDARPVIATVWQGNDLVMVMPFAEVSGFGTRVLETLTAADAEYSLPLSRACPDEDAAFAALLESLRANGRWDLVRLNSVPQEHIICSLAEPRNAIPSELQYSSIIEFDGFKTLDDYLATRSKSSRRSLRRKLQAFEKLGHVECTIVPVTAESMKPMFARVCEWKRQWFAANGVLGGNFNSSEMERHLMAFCRTDGVGEPTLASELRLDGQLVACDLMLQGAGVLYSYVTARDLAFHKYGVGTVMDMYTIRHGIEHGYKAFDLLSGPNPSKDSLSNKQVPLVDLRFVLSDKGRMQASIDRLRVRDQIKNAFYKLPLGIRQSVVALRSGR